MLLECWEVKGGEGIKYVKGVLLECREVKQVKE